MSGYKQLITYKLARIIFDLTWEFVPEYYSSYDDSRQRSQMKQCVRSMKQNVVEGSEERSLSSKLKLYDVARSSGGELLEDYEDIIRKENVPTWDKNDTRLKSLRKAIEDFPSSPSHPSSPPKPSCSSVLSALGRKRGKRWLEGKEGKKNLEIITNYLIDLIVRYNYLMDRQLDSIEKKHEQEGGYTENLYKRRKKHRGY